MATTKSKLIKVNYDGENIVQQGFYRLNTSLNIHAKMRKKETLCLYPFPFNLDNPLIQYSTRAIFWRQINNLSTLITSISGSILPGHPKSTIKMLHKVWHTHRTILGGLSLNIRGQLFCFLFPCGENRNNIILPFCSVQTTVVAKSLLKLKI